MEKCLCMQGLVGKPRPAAMPFWAKIGWRTVWQREFGFSERLLEECELSTCYRHSPCGYERQQLSEVDFPVRLGDG